MQLSADERRSVLGVFAVGQLAVFLLLLLPPPVCEYIGRPVFIWAGWDRHRPGDVMRLVVETQQWIGWMVEFDSRLLVSLMALSQLLLTMAIVCYWRPGWRVSSALGLLAVTLALLVTNYAGSRKLGDSIWPPLLFCLAYVAPLVLDGLRPAGLRLKHLPPEAPAQFGWQYGLRGLMAGVFAASILISLASAANTPMSLVWLCALSNGLFLGLGMWVAVRVVLSPRPLWMGLPVLLLALAASHCLLLFNTWTYGAYVPMFGTRWLSIYSMTQGALMTGMARLIAWNLAFVGLSALVVRACGYRLLATGSAAADSAAQPIGGTDSSAALPWARSQRS